MSQFQITLKNEKIHQYNRIALFFIILNLALFFYIAVSTQIRPIKVAAMGGCLFIIIALIIDYFLTSVKNNEGSPYKLAAEFVISMTWLYMEYWWVALLCFLLGTFYQTAKRTMIVAIFKEKIIYPSIPPKKIAWSDLHTIILKDGLLTINFKDDKFIQQSIDESKTSVSEQEFNDFCREQLNK